MFIQYCLDRTRENKLSRRWFCFSMRAHGCVIRFSLCLFNWKFSIIKWIRSAPMYQTTSIVFFFSANKFLPVNIETHCNGRYGSVEVAEKEKKEEEKSIFSTYRNTHINLLHADTGPPINVGISKSTEMIVFLFYVQFGRIKLWRHNEIRSSQSLIRMKLFGRMNCCIILAILIYPR